jgi:sugar phosphate isomerase/epimerase
MRLGFNGATSMNYDLETDIRLAQKAGFELLEIWAAKLNKYLEASSLESLKQLFEEANIKPYSINSIEFITFKEGEDYEKIKSECKRFKSRIKNAFSSKRRLTLNRIHIYKASCLKGFQRSIGHLKRL